MLHHFKHKILFTFLIVCFVSNNETAIADVIPLFASQSAHDWSGPYLGFNAGGAWGSFQPRSQTVAGGAFTEDQAVAFNTLGSLQSINPTGYSAGITGGYNWQLGHAVFGIETDIQGMHYSGATNSIGLLPDTNGNFFNINSYARMNWLITLRPRIGITFNNTLLYGTAGIAATTINSDSNVVASQAFGLSETRLESLGSISSSKIGYVLGGGAEYALSPSTSVKAEYLYTQFTPSYVTTNINTLLPVYPAQQFSHSISMNTSLARVGLNYKIGEPFLSKFTTDISNDPRWTFLSDFEVETGARAWVSSGNVGAPQPLHDFNNALISRLIYTDEQGYSYEAFARVDHVTGIFAKGFLGAGGISGGKINDEDFPGETAYSNTVSNNNQGSLSYANLDLGYNLIRTTDAKVGAFIGYNYYGQQVYSYGCNQIALSTDCAVPQASTTGLGNDNRYHSLRVGLSTEVNLTDKIKLTTDAAYIPYSDYRGHDDHNSRQLLRPESAQGGYGTMLEGIINYEFIKSWSVGIGARYWAFNTSTGIDTPKYLVNPVIIPSLPARFNTERYGGFIQLSHKIGDRVKETKAKIEEAKPINWSGIYIGGHIGGGFGDSFWNDPYGPIGPSNTPSGNAPGFGDSTHSMGPLGGGQLGINYQINQWVLGVQADASATDMRGENTCFSGLGGVNCMSTINSVGSIAARGGFAIDNMLIFVKGGGAWANSNFDVNGYTGILQAGSRSYNSFYWGWVAGLGLEYAIDNKWSIVAEFNNLWLNTGASYPTIDMINTNYVNIRQNLDIFKFGVNYRVGFN